MNKRRIAAVLAASGALGVMTALPLAWLGPGWDWKFLPLAFAAGFLFTRPLRRLLGALGRWFPALATWVGGPVVLGAAVIVLREAKPDLFTEKRLALGAAVVVAGTVLGFLGESRPDYRWWALPGFWVAFAVTTVIWCVFEGGWTLVFGWSVGVVSLVLLGIAVVDYVADPVADWLSPRIPWEAFLLAGVAATALFLLVDWEEERRERKAILPVSRGAIAYLRHAPDGKAAVDTIVQLEGRTRRETLVESVKRETSIAWGPRGQKLAFVRGDDKASHIWMYDLDARSAVRVTVQPGDYDDPAWSPDGKEIAFVKRESEDRSDIYVSRASRRSKARQLTKDSMSNIDPTWSPDGEQVAFASNRTGQFDIYVTSSDGARVARLTRGPRYSAVDEQPAWSPNGRTIAFVSRAAPGFRADIYLVDANGRGSITNLTRRATESSTDPAWSPDASQIAFTRMHRTRRAVFRVVVQGPDEDDFGHTEEVKGAAQPSYAPAWKPLPDPDLRWVWIRDEKPPRVPPDKLLAQRYAPLVRLHEHEQHWPMGASDFIRKSTLEWRGCKQQDPEPPFEHPPLERKLGGGETPGDTDDAYSIDRTGCPGRSGKAFVHDRTRPKDTDAEGFVLVPDDAETLHGRPPTTGERGGDGEDARRFISGVPVYYEYVAGRSLTYWMFYGFSATKAAGRLGEHQGDWERITVCLDPSERPISVVYHRHNTNRARSWPLVPKFGTHPVVYSAQGSHAAYPSAGTNPVFGAHDRRDEGPIWATWKSVRSVLHEQWYGYGGSWGVPPGPDGPSRFKVGDEGC